MSFLIAMVLLPYTQIGINEDEGWKREFNWISKSIQVDSSIQIQTIDYPVNKLSEESLDLKSSYSLDSKEYDSSRKLKVMGSWL